ncbi:Os02g0216300, partial [Oryza sativa Japonica Group]
SCALCLLAASAAAVIFFRSVTAPIKKGSNPPRRTNLNVLMSSKLVTSPLKSMEQGHLEQPLRDPQAPAEQHDMGLSPLTLLGFAFLTFNSGMAVYRSDRDLATIFFVVFSYVDLVSLFYFLRLFEKTPPESPRRHHIKTAVWLLTTMLTAVFSYKVAAIMPFPVQVLVWAMAAATVLGGFYAFFLHSDEKKPIEG